MDTGSCQLNNHMLQSKLINEEANDRSTHNKRNFTILVFPNYATMSGKKSRAVTVISNNFGINIKNNDCQISG